MTTPRPTAFDLTTDYAQVLLPVDFSRDSWRALPLANAMARTFDVPRRILHVDTASPWLDEGTNRLVLRATPTGQPVDVEVLAAATAAAGIVRALGDDESSLLVMSTHGHTAAAELAMGSTTEAVLRQWRGPVLAAGPRMRVPRAPATRIVLCAEPAAAVPIALVDDVRAWAARLRVPVEILSITTFAMAGDPDYLRAIEHRITSLADLLEVDGAPVHIERRDASREAHEIVKYADATPGTVIAMASHARPTAPRLLLGSVAMAVLRHSQCPVLLRRFEPVSR